MPQTLQDLFFQPDFFETSFIEPNGQVYSVQSVSSPMPPIGRIRRALGSFGILRFGNSSKRKIDYGIAHCRLASGIRYTLSIEEHLSDRANPTVLEVHSSMEVDSTILDSLGPERLYLLA